MKYFELVQNGLKISFKFLSGLTGIGGILRYPIDN